MKAAFSKPIPPPVVLEQLSPTVVPLVHQLATKVFAQVQRHFERAGAPSPALSLCAYGLSILMPRRPFVASEAAPARTVLRVPDGDPYRSCRRGRSEATGPLGN